MPHNLIVGIARISGTAFRYKLFAWDGERYQRVEQLDCSLPILFKPMGTPRPEGDYIASDADYVDFITELMGGFSIPPEVKELRKGKQYLLMGMRLNRDTERMVMADIIYSSAQPAGWVFIATPTEKIAIIRLATSLVDVSTLLASGVKITISTAPIVQKKLIAQIAQNRRGMCIVLAMSRQDAVNGLKLSLSFAP